MQRATTLLRAAEQELDLLRGELEEARSATHLHSASAQEDYSHLKRGIIDTLGEQALQRLLDRPRVVVANDQPLGGTVPSYSVAMLPHHHLGLILLDLFQSGLSIPLSELPPTFPRQQ